MVPIPGLPKLVKKAFPTTVPSPLSGIWSEAIFLKLTDIEILLVKIKPASFNTVSSSYLGQMLASIVCKCLYAFYTFICVCF